MKYEELKKVYVQVHKTNGIEDTRKLMVINENNKTIDLCRLKLRGKNSEELNKVVGYLILRNPKIEVGY